MSGQYPPVQGADPLGSPSGGLLGFPTVELLGASLFSSTWTMKTQKFVGPSCGDPSQLGRIWKVKLPAESTSPGQTSESHSSGGKTVPVPPLPSSLKGMQRSFALAPRPRNTFLT